MPARFINLDGQTPMFLSCDLREWIPNDHLVHFIVDAVEELPLSDFQVNHRGTGSEQYPPAMMLALPIYCYATGRFGWRTGGHLQRRVRAGVLQLAKELRLAKRAWRAPKSKPMPASTPR